MKNASAELIAKQEAVIAAHLLKRKSPYVGPNPGIIAIIFPDMGLSGKLLQLG
jgi:predicted protein tyrosine phosphatase